MSVILSTGSSMRSEASLSLAGSSKLNIGSLFNSASSFLLGAIAVLNPTVGGEWTEQASGNQNWKSIASSFDGKRTIAAAYGGYIYQSDDYGNTWLPIGGGGNWKSVACSQDGSVILAANYNGQITVKNPRFQYWNSGLLLNLIVCDGGNWVRINGLCYQLTSTTGLWNSVAMSSDGNRMAAAQTNGKIYISENGGEYWMATGEINDWSSIAMSADGRCLAATVYGGKIYISTDYGVTWYVSYNVDSNWISIASSFDGGKLAAVVYGGSIFVSTNGGNTWTHSPPPTTASFLIPFTSVSTSMDGKLLVAVRGAGVADANGTLWVSRDFGLTWDNRGIWKNWSSVACSPLGNFIAATHYGYKIYTSGGQEKNFDIFSTSNISILETSTLRAGIGAEWTARKTDAGRNWRSVASSANGQYLAAVVYGGYVYTSNDWGEKWIEHQNGPAQFWTTIASSSDGQRLFASRGGNQLLTSINAGLSWTIKTAYGAYHAIASSSSGQYLVAGVLAGHIWTSKDYGDTWVQRTGPLIWPYTVNFTTYYRDFTDWIAVASSSGGDRLVATNAISIWTSSDYGETWVRSALPSLPDNWPYPYRFGSVASSSTGQYLVAASQTGFIYKSNDYGRSWYNATASLGPKYWTSVASSDNGTRLSATAANEAVYISNNSGVTWTATDSNRNWSSVASSADGKKLVAVVGNPFVGGTLDGGYIYTTGNYAFEMFVGTRIVFINSVQANVPLSLIALGATANLTPRQRLEAASSFSLGATSNLTLRAGLKSVHILSSVSLKPNVRLVSPDKLNTASSVVIGANVGLFCRSKLNTASSIVLGAEPNMVCGTGVEWIPSGGVKMWSSITVSDDGKTLAAVVENGMIYKAFSTPEGLLWSARANDVNRKWKFITSSRYGEYMAAVVDGGNIWTSRNYGETWFPNIDASGIFFNRNWRSIASSSTGQYLVAVVGNDSNTSYPVGGHIYTSSNYGETWFARMTDAGRNWYSVTSSSSGQYLAAVTKTSIVGNVVNGLIYTSDNYGVTWTARMTDVSRNWTSITSSSTGKYLAAVHEARFQIYLGMQPGLIWTSTDYGANWTARMTDADRAYSAIASSADGDTLVAVAYGGQIYISFDYGNTWTPRDSNRYWRDVAISKNGTLLAAVVDGGLIYTSGGATDKTRQLFASQSTVSLESRPKLGFIALLSAFQNIDIRGAAALSSQFILAAQQSGLDLPSRGVVVQSGQYSLLESGFGIGWSARAIEEEWEAVALSINGRNMVATTRDTFWPINKRGGLYTSSDGGSTWVKRQEHYAQKVKLASLSYGEILFFAGAYQGISKSTDYGVTWISLSGTRVYGQSDTTTVRNWGGIASSEDGRRLIVVSDYIWTSSDGGLTWDGGKVGSYQAVFSDCCSSYEGKYLAAVQGGGTYNRFYISTDYGVSWVTHGQQGDFYTGVTSSRDGKNLGLIGNGYIYTSDNYGATWVQRMTDGVRNWTSITSSSTGQNLAAVVGGGKIYISNDYGATWVSKSEMYYRNGDGSYRILDTNRNWRAIGSSKDFSILAALDYNSSTEGGRIYITGNAEATRAMLAATSSIALRAQNNLTRAVGFDWELRFGNSNRTEPSSGYFIPTAGGVGEPLELPVQYFSAVESSADGANLFATVLNDFGYIWCSTDKGFNWIRLNYERKGFSAITSSWGGTVLAAIANYDEYTNLQNLMVSRTSGVGALTNVSPISDWPLRTWIAIKASWNGQFLAAVNPYGYIWTSTNYGDNWTRQISPGQRHWRSIAVSQDGKFIAAVSETATGFANEGRIYTSSDFGVTWFARTVPEPIQTWTTSGEMGQGRHWHSIAMSYDGKYLVASSGNGVYAQNFTGVNLVIYTSSDFGVTWVRRMTDANRNWDKVTVSDNGRYMAATVENGYIYTSNDFGATWVARMTDANRAWKGIVWAQYGKHLAAVTGTGEIYTSGFRS